MLGIGLFFILIFGGTGNFYEKIVWAGVVAQGEYSDTVSWTLDDNGVLTVNGGGEWEAQDIGYYKQIKKIIFKPSVTMVPEYFLFSQENLSIEEVIFENRNGTIQIGNCAFGSAQGKFFFGRGTYYLGENLFHRQRELDLEFQGGTYYLGSEAFGYASIAQMNCSDGKMVMESNAVCFSYITLLSMEQMDVEMKYKSFIGTSIENLCLNSGSYVIGESAFYTYPGMKGISKVYFGDGIYEISDAAFEGGQNIEEFVVKDSNRIVKISENSFKDCKLEHIYSMTRNPEVEKVIPITDKILRMSISYQGENIVQGGHIISGQVKLTCVSQFFGTYTLYGNDSGVKLYSSSSWDNGKEKMNIEVNYCDMTAKTSVGMMAKNVTSLSASYDGSVLEGTDIDLSNVVLLVNYNNGTRDSLDGNAKGIGYSTKKAWGNGEGISVITMTYKGCSCILSVVRTPKSLDYIEAVYEGEVLEECKLDKDKIKLNLYYNNGTTEQAEVKEEELFLSDEWIRGKGEGENEVLLSYQNKQTILKVRRKAKTLKHLTAWYDGEILEGKEPKRDKLKVTAYYDNDTQEEIQEYTLYTDKIVPGINYMNVEYGECHTSCPVYGVKKSIAGITGEYLDEAIEGTLLDRKKFQVMLWYDNDTYEPWENYWIKENEIQQGENEIQIGFENVSGIVNVTGKKKSLISISAKYSEETITEGMPLIPEKLTVTAYYDNGSSEEVKEYQTEEKEIVLGENTLQIHYENMCTQLKIHGKKASLLEISAAYDGQILEGMTVDTGKLHVIGYYDNGKKEEITTYELGNYDIQVGMNSIRITAMERTCFLSVEGKEKTATGMTAAYMGETWEGTSVIKTQIKVTKLFNNGSREETLDFKIVPTVLVKGNNQIEVSCGQLKTMLCVVGKEVNSIASAENENYDNNKNEKEQTNGSSDGLGEVKFNKVQKQSYSNEKNKMSKNIESNVSIKISDNKNQIKGIYYTKKTVRFSFKKLMKQGYKVYYKTVIKGKNQNKENWKQGKNGLLKVQKGKKLATYFKIVAPWGETKYIQSQFFTIEHTAPQLKGVKQGGKYKKKASISFQDKESGISYVKLNGKKISKQSLRKGKLTVKKKGKYKILAVNKAGMKSKLAFYIG